MERKKKWGTGYRREIAYILHNNGVLPYPSIQILYPNLTQRKNFLHVVSDMKREGTLGVKRAGNNNRGTRLLYMSDYKNQKENYQVNIPQSCIEYYENDFLHFDKLYSFFSAKKSMALRAIQEAKLNLLMYASGLDTFSDQVGNSNSFYLAVTFKRIANEKGESLFNKITDTNVGTPNNDIESILKESRAHAIGYLKSYGVAYINEDIFSVYICGSSLTAIVLNETNITKEYKKYAEDNAEKRGWKYTKETPVSALIVMESLVCLPRIIDYDENYVSAKQIKYESYEKVYQGNIYAVDYTYESSMHIYLMQRSNWKLIDLINIIPGYSNISYSSLAGFNCDYYDTETSVATLFFMIPNIHKLKGFIGEVRRNPGKYFNIICYDYQREAVEELVGDNDNVKIKSISISAYYYYYKLTEFDDWFDKLWGTVFPDIKHSKNNSYDYYDSNKNIANILIVGPEYDRVSKFLEYIRLNPDTRGRIFCFSHQKEILTDIIAKEGINDSKNNSKIKVVAVSEENFYKSYLADKARRIKEEKEVKKQADKVERAATREAKKAEKETKISKGKANE